MKLFSLVALVFAISSCLAIEMPDYEVIQQLGNNMEIRKYPATKWVYTTMDSQKKDGNRSKSFWRLFDYISGANQNNQKIEMTAPVLINYTNNISKKTGKSTQLPQSMNFYVPAKFSNSPPVPTAPNVMIKEIPETTVAVARFGGYASMDDYIKYRDNLVKALGSDSKEYDIVNMISAGYDAPFKPFFRRNEVWLRKTN
jgi:hypothetical protein